MNIQALLERIDLFNELAIESGLLRDLEAYQTALTSPETQTNLVALKDIATKANEGIKKAMDGGLYDALNVILPGETNFLDPEPEVAIDELLADPEIDTNGFYTKLNSTLTKAHSDLKADKAKIDNLRVVFGKYVHEHGPDSDPEKAVLALVLKDLETITSLQKFARTLDRWNRTLMVYHQLLSSKSPEDIGLVGVQEGSVDVAFNIDVNIGINLAELMRLGIEVFVGYLVYKTKIHEIVLTYHGNKKLIADEKQREADLLANVRLAIDEKIKEQHTKALKSDKGINKESVPKKIEQVSTVLAGHIIRGNELRLLSAGTDESVEKETDDQTEEPSLTRSLRAQTRKAEILKGQLPETELGLLISQFPEDEEGKKNE